MAGILTRSGWPHLLTSWQWLYAVARQELTAAGTVTASHRVPSFAPYGDQIRLQRYAISDKEGAEHCLFYII